MKNIKIIAVTLFAFIAFATACRKITTVPVTEACGQLPCPTTIGANVASCMINGEPFIVKGKGKSIGMFNCTSGNTFKYGTLAGGYTLEFFKCSDGTNKTNNIYFQFSGNPELKKYLIGKPLFTGCSLYTEGGGFFTISDSTSTGEIEITYLDNSIISGKFKFVTKDYNTGKTYTCTNGNFDLSK
jgi:hypothetical protein